MKSNFIENKLKTLFYITIIGTHLYAYSYSIKELL